MNFPTQVFHISSELGWVVELAPVDEGADALPAALAEAVLGHAFWGVALVQVSAEVAGVVELGPENKLASSIAITVAEAVLFHLLTVRPAVAQEPPDRLLVGQISSDHVDVLVSELESV
jgi:hypothetical protein